MESSFLMVKPDAVGRPWLLETKEVVEPEDGEGEASEQVVVKTLASDKLDVLRQKLARGGLSVAKERRQVLSIPQAERFLAGPEGRASSQEEIEFLASGPVVCMIVEGENCVDALNDLMGPSDPVEARLVDEAKRGDDDEMSSWSLRGALGTDAVRNACHGSASSYHAAWETAMFFPERSKWQRTLAMVKPNAYGSADEIIAAAESAGLVVCARSDKQLSDAEARDFYAEHDGKSFFEELIAFMTESPVAAIAFEGINAISAWRLLMGPTNGSCGLRSAHAENITRNGMHGSDSVASAARELAFWFPDPIPSERTLALIKPETADVHAAAILGMIAEHGFTVEAKTRVRLSLAEACRFYAEHKGRSFYGALTSYMSSGPAVAMVLSKPGAIKSWRHLIGPTNVAEARRSRASCIRAQFGIDNTKNACHGSDSPASASREIAFFFPQVSNKTSSVEKAEAYLAERPACGEAESDMPTMNKVLVDGLVELCKVKPSGLDAVQWLGEWLLRNNPNASARAKAESAIVACAAKRAARNRAAGLVSPAEKCSNDVVEATPSASSEDAPNDGAVVEVPAAGDSKIVFVLGGPGSCKSVQCEMIVAEYGYTHVKVKDLLVKEAARGTKQGAAIEEALKKQQRVDTGIIISLIARAMSRSGNSKFLIDGFPRDRDQAFAFEKQIGKCSSVLFFDDPEHVRRERLEAEGAGPAAIDRRIREYDERSLPLIEFYSKLGLVRTISTFGATEDHEHTFQQVRVCLEPTVVFVVGGAPEAETNAVCSYVASNFGYEHVSAKRMLEQEAKKGTREAHRLERILASGSVVPTSIVMDMFSRVFESSAASKFIVSGFPQSMEHLREFESSITAAPFSLRLVHSKADTSSDEDLVIASLSATGRLRDVDVGSSSIEHACADVRDHFSPEIVLALGREGSGCAEHADSAARRFGYTLFNDVDVLRCEVSRGSPLGVEASAMMEKGMIVPVDLKLRMLRDAILASGESKFIIHGFPRAIDHCNAFYDRFGPPAMALYFRSDEETCKARLLDGDDAANEARVNRSLEAFKTQTVHAVNSLARRGLLRIVDASASPAEVRKSVAEHFKKPVLVALGDGGIGAGRVRQHLEALAESKGYAYMDARAMFAEAKKQGTYEGQRLARGKQVQSEVLSRASESCGKAGIVLDGYPATESEIGHLIHAFQAPKLAIRFHCAPSAARARYEADARSAAEEKDDGDVDEEALAAESEAFAASVASSNSASAEIASALAEKGAEVVHVSTASRSVASELRAAVKPELLVVAGPDAAAREHLATHLARERGYVRLDVATLYENEISKGTRAGAAIAAAAKKSQTTPLEVSIGVIQAAVRSSGASKYIVDGFPLVVSDGFPFAHDQAFELEESVGTVTAVVQLDASEESIAGRSRGGARAARDAMEAYTRQSRPVVEFYASTSGVVTVDASGDDLDAMRDAVVDELEKLDEVKRRAAERLLQAQLDEKRMKDMIRDYEASLADVSQAESYFGEFELAPEDRGSVKWDELCGKLEGWGIVSDPREHFAKPDEADEWADVTISSLDWCEFYFASLKAVREAEAAAKAAADAEAKAKEAEEGDEEGDEQKEE